MTIILSKGVKIKMENYLQLKNELIQIKYATNNLESMLVELRQEMVMTILADGKVLGEELFNDCIDLKNQIKNNTTTAMSIINKKL